MIDIDKLTIVFEGTDGSGKSTLIQELNKKYSNLNIELVDRSFISDYVYALKFDRELIDGIPYMTYVDYWGYWHKNNRDTRIVLCNPSIGTIASRCIRKNEPFARNRTFDELCEYMQRDKDNFLIFSNFLAHRYKMPILEVNTDNYIKETIKQIEDFIDLNNKGRINDTKI